MDPVRNREVPQQGFNDKSAPNQQASGLEKKTESVSSREFEKMEGLSEAVSVLKITRSPKQSEKLAEGIDSLVNKMKTSFDFCGKEIVSAAISLFANANLTDWPADEAQQKLYILEFIENLATERLRLVMQKGPTLRPYYESVSHLAPLYSLLSNNKEVLAQYLRRFDKYFDYFYPPRQVMDKARIEVFISSQKLLKNLLNGEQVQTAKIQFKGQVCPAYLFEGLAWTIRKDAEGRIVGVEAFRLSEEDRGQPYTALSPMKNGHPWNDTYYEIIEFPEENFAYWEKRIDSLLSQITRCNNPESPADKERLIGLLTYATARFQSWGHETGTVLPFQAKLLSNILGAKPPLASPDFYDQTLIHSEKSFCDSIYLPAIQGKPVPVLPQKFTYDPQRELEVGDFLSQSNPKLKDIFASLPKFVGEDYQQAAIIFQNFTKEDDPHKALPSVQAWVSKLLAARKESHCAPALVMHFVITPLLQSILAHIGKRGEGALDFLNWYVPNLERFALDRGYGSTDQRIFALYSHMTAVVAKMRLIPFNNKGMEKKEWEGFMDWLGVQRGLMAWLTRTKNDQHFGARRYAAGITTPFSQLYSDWREFNEKRALGFYERLEQEPALPLIPIRVPKKGVLVDKEAYIFEGLAWLPKYVRDYKFKDEERFKLKGYEALVLDDFNPAEKPVGGTLIVSSHVKGHLMEWKHGDGAYWEEPSFQLFNEVLCKNNIQELPQTLGHLSHTHAQYVRYIRGTAAISHVLDVAMRMVKELPIPQAKKNLDCYALSMSAREFIDTVYIQQQSQAKL